MVGAAQLNSSLLIISVIAVLLPAAFHFAVANDDSTTDDAAAGMNILRHVALLSYCRLSKGISNLLKRFI